MTSSVSNEKKRPREKMGKRDGRTQIGQRPEQGKNCGALPSTKREDLLGGKKQEHGHNLEGGE